MTMLAYLLRQFDFEGEPHQGFKVYPVREIDPGMLIPDRDFIIYVAM